MEELKARAFLHSLEMTKQKSEDKVSNGNIELHGVSEVLQIINKKDPTVCAVGSFLKAG
ncbi:MAG TPA: hypothetical protein VGE06_07690 [Flavisolibacter sp.]